MKMTRMEDGAVVMSDDRMTGRRLYASEAATVIYMTINPGKEILPHPADVDMEFFVIEGKGRFSVGDESALAEAGTLVESPAGLPHGISNAGERPLVILAIKNGKR
jgi:mannose-6-phosphate isomerase-like protein (cupin superfamily)